MQNLQSQLESSSSPSPLRKLLELEREFHVPVNQLFAAFSSPEALKQWWWWPEGLYSDQIDMDFKEGGDNFINMKGYEKGGGGMTGRFIEIVENERIVMSDQFSDEHGMAISAQEAHMPGLWPELITITFEFEAVDESRSRFKLFQTGIPEELMKDCIQGWSESFNKLREYLDDSIWRH